MLIIYLEKEEMKPPSIPSLEERWKLLLHDLCPLELMQLKAKKKGVRLNVRDLMFLHEVWYWAKKTRKRNGWAFWPFFEEFLQNKKTGGEKMMIEQLIQQLVVVQRRNEALERELFVRLPQGLKEVKKETEEGYWYFSASPFSAWRTNPKKCGNGYTGYDIWSEGERVCEGCPFKEFCEYEVTKDLSLREIVELLTETIEKEKGKNLTVYRHLKGLIQALK